MYTRVTAITYVYTCYLHNVCMHMVYATFRAATVVAAADAFVLKQVVAHVPAAEVET